MSLPPGAAAAAGCQPATKQIAGSQGGRDAQNRKICRKVHDVSIGLDSRKYSAIRRWDGTAAR